MQIQKHSGLERQRIDFEFERIEKFYLVCMVLSTILLIVSFLI